MRESGLLVCKVAIGWTEMRKLRYEAEVYANQLQEIQGDEVPKFFGLYDGDSGTASVSVMVLEHCGEALSVRLDRCDVNLRYAAIVRLRTCSPDFKSRPGCRCCML